MDNLTTSPIEIPKQTGGATAYWIGENDTITDSDLTFGMIKLTPRAVAAMMKFSNRVLRMSNPSIEAIARRDMAQVLALAIDLAAYIGDGQANEPLGIVNTAGINTLALGTNGDTPNFDTLMNIAYEVEVDHALYGSLGFVFHPAIRKILSQLKVAQYSGDTSGEYVIMPMDAAQLQSYIGYKYTTTTQIPINLTKGGSTDCTHIIFGNWQEMIIAGWAGLEIMASQETSTAFEKNQTWVRIIQEVDFAVRQPTAFCVCSDART